MENTQKEASIFKKYSKSSFSKHFELIEAAGDDDD